MANRSPDRRWLSIRLHYMDHTPENYDPPGFRRLDIEIPGLRIQGDAVRQKCGVMNTGFHTYNEPLVAHLCQKLTYMLGFHCVCQVPMSRRMSRRISLDAELCLDSSVLMTT